MNNISETPLRGISTLKKDILLNPIDIENDIYYIVHILRKLKNKFNLDQNICNYINTEYNYIRNPNGMYIKFYYKNFILHISIFNSDVYEIDKSVWGPVHLTLERHNIKLARISNIGYVNIYDQINLLLYQHNNKQKGGVKKRKRKRKKKLDESKLINIENELNNILTQDVDIYALLDKYNLNKNKIYNYINFRNEQFENFKIKNESIKEFVNNFVNILYLNKYFPKLNRIYFEEVFDFFTDEKLFEYFPTINFDAKTKKEKFIEKIEDDYGLKNNEDDQEFNKDYQEYKEGKKDSNDLIYYIIQYINENNLTKKNPVRKISFEKKYMKYKIKYLNLLNKII